MSDRLAELLTKGKAGQLTPAETQELAHLLNAPLLDPLTKPRAEFVSKHSFAPGDVTARLRAVDWFSQCGKRVSLDLSMPVEMVANWQEAVEHCTDPGWENVQLEAQSQLSVWLHQHDRESYRSWNELVLRHKAAAIDQLSQEKWGPYQRERRLDARMVSSIQWDVLGALMENSYLSSGHSCFFFLELLLVYEAGHFPCGWRGDWPHGTLLVY